VVVSVVVVGTAIALAAEAAAASASEAAAPVVAAVAVVQAEGTSVAFILVCIIGNGTAQERRQSAPECSRCRVPCVLSPCLEGEPT
jgi:hypothetical protein